MKRLERVLVAVDFSDAARAAFERALALSAAHGAELTVVHAVPADQPFNWHARERIALIGSLRHAAHAAGVDFRVSIQHGDPAGVILLHASARRPDLVVLGTSERTGVDRWRFGSVAEKVAVEATQSVLVVPPGAAGSLPLEHILVAVDLGEGSSAAVERALSLATAKTRVTVLHVIPGTSSAAASRYTRRLMHPEYQHHLARHAWRRMAEIVPAGTASQVDTRVVIGDPASEISRVTRDVGAGLVLVGVTPRGAVGRLLFGSTAVRVIRDAGVPVMAMPLVEQRLAPAPAEAAYEADVSVAASWR